jgi:hypothetical protein
VFRISPPQGADRLYRRDESGLLIKAPEYHTDLQAALDAAIQKEIWMELHVRPKGYLQLACATVNLPTGRRYSFQEEADTVAHAVVLVLCVVLDEQSKAGI